MLSEEQFAVLRHKMVQEQLITRQVEDKRVLHAMRKVPRHQFVPNDIQYWAYDDAPLPIGEHQTISQPYMVAMMTERLALQGTERVLEIGTGCGYQTAILCELAQYVYSLERYPLLAGRAAETLHKLGYQNIDVHIGDGSQGLPDMEPFDAIIVTAAAPHIPSPLTSQLCKEGGRLVVPVGSLKSQHLYVIRRDGDYHSVERSVPVRFVPLVGRYGFKDAELPHNKRDPNPPASVE